MELSKDMFLVVVVVSARNGDGLSTFNMIVEEQVNFTETEREMYEPAVLSSSLDSTARAAPSRSWHCRTKQLS